MRVTAEDLDFLTRFATGEMSRGEFRHTDHVHLAWVLLTEIPLLVALSRFRATQPELFSHPKVLFERYYPGGSAFSATAKESFLLPTGTPKTA